MSMSDYPVVSLTWISHTRVSLPTIHFEDEFRPQSDKKIVLFELSDPQLDLRILAPDRVGVIAVSCPPEDEVTLTSTAALPDCDVPPSLV